MTLSAALEVLPPPLLARLRKRGFEEEQLLSWAQRMGEDLDVRNRLVGDVRPVPAGSVQAPAPVGSDEHKRFQALGAGALERGELAICVLAGGMATRMGGVVKALVDVTEGVSFLDVKMMESARLGRSYGHAPPLWLMTSEPTDPPIVKALAARTSDVPVATFEQFVSLRLSEEGGLFLDEQGQPSVYATGHGDLPDALRAAGLLSKFNEAGGKYVWISNIDNLGASIDLALLGQHIDSAAELSVEVVDKEPGDTGGGPVLHEGRPIIAEHFRLPKSFDPATVPVFNTNTFIVSTQRLAELTMPWTYLQVSKQVGGRPAVQFERLLGELTVGMSARFQQVPRAGEPCRFLPMKSRDDLSLYQPAIRQIVDKLSFRG